MVLRNPLFLIQSLLIYTKNFKYNKKSSHFLKKIFKKIFKFSQKIFKFSFKEFKIVNLIISFLDKLCLVTTSPTVSYVSI